MQLNLKQLEKNPLEAQFQAGKEYLRLLLTSREADLREGVLFRQGKGFVCTPSAGHENMAAVALATLENDYIYCHYRDRALLLAKGASLRSLALTFFAKQESSSAGRQMAGHYSDPDHNIISCASPIASQCIPAAGSAWAAKLKGQGEVIICCIGEAGARQGEFYEAYAFAVQEKLPIIFVIEDNGYGISTPTGPMNPFNLGIFNSNRTLRVNGRAAEEVYEQSQFAVNTARNGGGPSILWISFDRLLSHTSSDDQRVYRATDEIELCRSRDPITLLKDGLYSQGALSADEYDAMLSEIREMVRLVYQEAYDAVEPDVKHVKRNVLSNISNSAVDLTFLQTSETVTYSVAINRTLNQLLMSNSRVLLFGEDIEDPKGGVFGLTRGLSNRFQGRVINAPLAEATICGVAVGLAVAGFLPIFEIQFIDFVATGFNQIINQLATMRWRTDGQIKCPAILLAPCGGYVQGAGPWHTQTNEGIFAHVPGLKVCMPSNAYDVSEIIMDAAAGDDPVLILLPKHLFFKEFSTHCSHWLPSAYANIIKNGDDVTIIAWGNCTELAVEASARLTDHGISAEVIDLKSIVPSDIDLIAKSVAKTGRVVIVHEDNRTCGFGQSLVSEITTNKAIWDTLYTAPQLVCRDDVLVPFNPELAQHVLPTVDKIIHAAILTKS